MATQAGTHHAAANDARLVSQATNPDASNIVVRKLTINDLKDCLKLGFEDFKAKPSHMLVLGLVYPLGAAIIAGYALGRDFLPMVFPVAAGLALLGPAAAIVLYEISRRREKGLDFSWREIGKVFDRASSWNVLILMAVLLAVFGVWLVVAQLLLHMTLGVGGDLAPLAFMQQLFMTPEGWTLIVLGNGAGFLFAAAVLAANVVSFPMLLDRDVGAPAAVATSLRVTAKNPITVAVWGFIIAASMAIGGAMFLVGLGVIVPVLGHATWHLYRKAVEH